METKLTNRTDPAKRGQRLYGFDYSSPYFYMVTLKRTAGAPPLSAVVDDPARHWLRPNELTGRILEAIRTFHETWWCVEPIRSFTIMPDHIHLLLKIRPVEKRLTLPRLVWLLVRSMEKACEGAGMTSRAHSGSAEGRSGAPRLFSLDWHDWIVLRAGQLRAFKRYISDNPRRRCLRHIRSGLFKRTDGVEYLERRWVAYGNAGLLKLPVIEPFRCSRSWAEGGGEWREAVARAERIGPGCAGIGTFMSPCEKACGHAIGVAGGRWIVLLPEGIGPFWHPTERLERVCASGRMLFLSPYMASAGKLVKSELHARCHEMGEWVETALGNRNRATERPEAEPV